MAEGLRIGVDRLRLSGGLRDGGLLEKRLLPGDWAISSISLSSTSNDSSREEVGEPNRGSS